MSFSSQVAHTRDILHIIFSHISDGKDLTSLLRTSPLFFGLIAQKLYRSLPISNVLNPLSGAKAGGRGGPYGKNKLLELVQTVVVERAPLPVDDFWANWDKLPPLPAVETVIIHPADRNARQEGGQDVTLPNNALIQWLCPTATRLHISTPCVTPGAKGVQSIPSLPCVETLVVKANAGQINELKYVVEKLYHSFWNHGQKEHPYCLNITAVHILLWGDLVNPPRLQSSDRDQDRVDDLAMMKLTLITNAHLQNTLFHDLCEIAERLGTRICIDNLRLWLYNADTVLERMSVWSKRRKVDDMKARVERVFGEVFGMPEEEAEGKVFWQTGLEFYEAFGDLSARDETEEWYHSAVLAPSPNLVSLRARLAAKTMFPAHTFVGLTEREAEWTLAAHTFLRLMEQEAELRWANLSSN
ncbi:hypothetical protein B9479_006407 [Cryptococcus floricola]|uniref:Uncharacterized protein n=1 Tax=Cryptococcus floricola TaxID=2591691 RepID=A0A5D3ANI0_9TREE|nr:hypothetical protein B9479_006407 [Cryptococcus floricola]